jgi:hypothetical protein
VLREYLRNFPVPADRELANTVAPATGATLAMYDVGQRKRDLQTVEDYFENEEEYKTKKRARLNLLTRGLVKPNHNKFLKAHAPGREH